MTFLPIVGREIRVAARRRWTYWNRFAAALAGIGFGGWLMMMDWGKPADLGQSLFASLSALIFIYVTLAGAQVTSDSLSQEKRDGTLGLLFLTDLKGYDVVFGKLAATSLTVCSGVMAMFPVLAIPMLLGGMSHGEFWRVVIVAINLLFFSLSAGLCASALSREGLRAAMLGTAFILTLCLGGPLTAFVMAAQTNYTSTGQPFLLTSPVYDCFVAFDREYRSEGPVVFCLNAALTQLYSWLFLLVACRTVPRSWQDRSQEQKAGFFKTIREFCDGPREERAQWRAGMLQRNPYFWRAARNRMKGRAVWLLLAGTGLVWVVSKGLITDSSFNEIRDLLAMIWLHFMLKSWVTAEACRHFCGDRRSGAMELLLSTPITARTIISGQCSALFRQFAGPAIVVLLVDLALMIHGYSESTRWNSGGTFYLIFGVFLIVDLLALPWVGMWAGLRGRSSNRALYVSLAQVLLLHVVICFIIVVGMEFTIPRHTSEKTFIMSWVITGLVVSLGFAIPAKSKLQARFREIVAEK